jgi:hypothetical protein
MTKYVAVLLTCVYSSLLFAVSPQVTVSASERSLLGTNESQA